MRTTLATVIAAGLLALAFASRGETFSGTLTVSPAWTHTETGATFRAETYQDLYAWSHTNGVGAGAMNRVWSGTLNLQGPTTQTLSLVSLTNAFGTVISSPRVRLLSISRDAQSTNPVAMAWGAHASGSLCPGGYFLVVAPDATAYTNQPAVFSIQGTNPAILSITVGGASP